MLRKTLLSLLTVMAVAPATAGAADYVVLTDDGARVPAAVSVRAGERLPLVGGFVADLSPAEAAALRRHDGVRAVVADTPMQPSTAGPSDGLATAFNASIRSTLAWRQGLSGAGVGVAVLDTGIQGDVADFGGRVVASAVVNDDATTAGDRYGHGTHVAGLIAGDSGAYRGVAPGAHLVSVKVSDDHGRVSLADVISGLQFVVDHRRELGIRVVNLSLTSAETEPVASSVLDAAVEAAWFEGLVVDTAAGNHGTEPGAIDRAPANDPYVITVGAVDDQQTKRTNDDELAAWSSRGPTAEGLAKPDMLAPGAHMISASAHGSDFEAACPQCLREGGHLQIGGTSMAAAVASGAAALVLEAHPDWTPDQVKGALAGTARDGLIDVPAAVRARGLVANAANRPSPLLQTADGSADWSRISWSRISWAAAQGDLAADWARISWSCDCPAAPAAEDVDPSRISWSRISWSRISWSRISWSRIGWSSSFRW